MPTIAEKNRESRLRRLATREGFAIQKSRRRNTLLNVNDYGGFRIIDPCTNSVAWGASFDLDLDDVERYLTS